MADTKRLQQLSKFRRDHIKNNHFFVSSLNISSGFVPQKMLDVIEGIRFLDIVLIILMPELSKYD